MCLPSANPRALKEPYNHARLLLLMKSGATAAKRCRTQIIPVYCRLLCAGGFQNNSRLVLKRLFKLVLLLHYVK